MPNPIIAKARHFGATLVVAAAFAALGSTAAQPVDPALQLELPTDLFATGLYSEPETLTVDPAHLAFSPQYPLWTDGAIKRRWISLPPGATIDAAGSAGWIFPDGTRFWKEFSFDGRPVETRFMEHQGAGRWTFAAYEWSKDGSTATLAPERGRAGAWPLSDGQSHTIPARTDCRVCHGSGPSPVLGFTALQLSVDRDPAAPHAEVLPDDAVDLAALIERGLITGLSDDPAPRIAATSNVERAALGYLHANCGHCHTDSGALADLGLDLAYEPHEATASARVTTVGTPLHKAPAGLPEGVVLRVAPGDPDASAVLLRMGSRNRMLQMPPLGTAIVDDEAVALLRAWVEAQDNPRADKHARIIEGASK
ncbi:hypothetical protein FP2506_02155 [Fulvimarina pelagi HTCC2506]|uniref:Cytochrome c domain-containing protein n=2 Tax=Fulvimarina pelagi TaxID=217511 RepID=Q0FYI9_9HYPH|nr:hypothetical protein [Fulvimarina pelagi]EAU40006.1 hypothetical protein FP2506_02155 [Fulvimarina pelagi HTCC2506]BAT31048.1 hypothetical protein [Fulvimarina pelagi]